MDKQDDIDLVICEDGTILTFDNLIGFTLNGYVIKELIKETGKSWEVMGHHLDLDVDHALNILKPGQGIGREEQFLKKGRNEAKRGRCKNLPVVHTAARDKVYDLAYIASEPIINPVGDFQDELNARTKFSLEEMLHRMEGAITGVNNIHLDRDVHGDIKLENMKMNIVDGETYILDGGGRLFLENYYGDDIRALANCFIKFFSCCYDKIPGGLEQIVRDASEGRYETVVDFQNAIENYRKGHISRRRFVNGIGATALAIPTLGGVFGLIKHLNYINSIDYIVDEINKVEATDYADINPLFKELLLRIIDHKIDWWIESGIVSRRKFPYATIENGSWFLTNGEYWSDGFWPGILWQCYEVTGKEKYRQWATEWTKAIDFTDKEKDDIRSIRFYYSHAKAYELTGDEFFRNKALKAAEFMASRFNEVGGFIQTGGKVDTTLTDKKINIDSIDVIPFLLWAFKMSGDEKYKDILLKHINTTMRYNVRDDGSTRRLGIFNPKTTKLIEEENDFGYKSNSTYSRGQARAINGFTLAYEKIKDGSFLEVAERLANYFIGNLPEDFIPFYDFDDPNKNIPKDSSAVTIAGSALIDLYTITGNENYKETYYNILKSLSSKTYLSTDLINYQGIILHGCCNKNKKQYINSSLIYSDYYFLEVIKKLK